MSRITQSIAFYCRESKASKKTGQAPIEMSIIISGSRKFINLPYKCKPSDFGKKRRPQEIETYLVEIRKTVDNIISDLLHNQMPVTPEAIREYLITGGYKSYTVGNLVDDYLDILNRRIGKDLTLASYNKYVRTSQILYDYVSKDKEVVNITPAVIQRIYADLKSKYEAQTSGGYMTKLKTIIKFGIDNGKITVNPFQGIKITKGKKQVTYLTEEEMSKIEAYTSDFPRLQRVADLFTLQLNTGLAYGDLMDISKDDLQLVHHTCVIRKQRRKTGETFTAVVLPAGEEILKKYDYQIPKLSNQKYNSYLKTIADDCGITKNLHTHLARHSYSCRLLRHGVDIYTTSKCLGHSSTKITQQYYADLETDKIVQTVTESFK